MTARSATGAMVEMGAATSANAGFSRADPARLYLPPLMDPIYGYGAVNVEALKEMVKADPNPEIAAPPAEQEPLK